MKPDIYYDVETFNGDYWWSVASEKMSLSNAIEMAASRSRLTKVPTRIVRYEVRKTVVSPTKTKK